ncbi:hypothetical protein LAD12857_18820 [Lacrimispora amygdalina]|uniref:DUF4430 domain-containing protein n=1 Tax=Lacrimispora amygdalina TaxID=253257 RepID=A0A3E2NGE6_9FIRM|nr:DUF4430 domain-containing protein [Clostridium indicum]RFZ80067.1 DUF4430 domain-containing protein [Clostridium indicum]
MNRFKRLSPFLGGCAAIAVLALLLVIYTLTRPVPMAGTKNITVDVVYEDGVTDHYQLTTEAQYLLEALKTIPDLTIEGTTTEELGLMVTKVNGRQADYKKDGAYWALLCDGEPCSYGVSQQAIKDGERYTFQYTPADSTGGGS